MVPAWVVAVYALASIIGILTIRPMPLLIRFALVSPRLLMLLLYLTYAIKTVTIETRSDVTRIAIIVMFFVEALTAAAVRWEWKKAKDLQ